MARTEAQKRAIAKYDAKNESNNIVWTRVRVPRDKVDAIRKEAEKMRLNP